MTKSDAFMMAVAKADAIDLAGRYGIDLTRDFHALPSGQVERIIEAADSVRYRQPRNANGSRARYFHARLVRTAGRGA
jgi:hypothetical protein